MHQPIITSCFNCSAKVFEFDEGHYGCDTCKSVFRWTGDSWKEEFRPPVIAGRRYVSVLHNPDIDNSFNADEFYNEKG